MVANNNEELSLHSQGYKYVAGVDESGMGSFAGDVYVAVVILPHNIDYKKLLPKINDSKSLRAEQRVSLYPLIKKYALAYATGTASVEEIDDINIYWARFLAARRAILSLKIEPDYIIIDGNKEIPDITIPQHAIVKGDQKSISIAAASIIAKVDRDTHIEELAEQVHEEYDWKNNKSYYSVKHVNAIRKHGKALGHRQKYVKKFLIQRDLGDDD